MAPLFVFILMACGEARGQPTSRTAEIEAERERKAAALAPEQNRGLERGLLIINEKKLVERILGGLNGLRIRLGGLPVAQGFALGPEYVREDLAKATPAFAPRPWPPSRGRSSTTCNLPCPSSPTSARLWTCIPPTATCRGSSITVPGRIRPRPAAPRSGWRQRSSISPAACGPGSNSR